MQTNQLTLDFNRPIEPAVGAGHPVTSFQAAAAVSESTTERDRRLICEFLAGRDSHGATDAEMQAALPQIDANAFRARRGECEKLGLIERIWEKRKVPGHRPALVFVVTEAGRNAA